MSRKREKPYFSRHLPYSYNPKRRRPHSPPIDDTPVAKPTPPPAVHVIGLPSGCSVLDLKARFEIYGSISRIRIDPDGIGLISFRSKASADSAISASLDPSFGISIDSHQVQVRWASEPKGEEERGGGVEEVKDRGNLSISSSSKLLKGGIPLSRHGRGNRLSSAIVNPNTSSSVLDPLPLKPREIVAYDDIL